MINFNSTIYCAPDQFKNANVGQKLFILSERYWDLGGEKYLVKHFSPQAIMIEKNEAHDSQNSLRSIILRITLAITILILMITLGVKAYYHLNSKIQLLSKQQSPDIQPPHTDDTHPMAEKSPPTAPSKPKLHRVNGKSDLPIYNVRQETFVQNGGPFKYPHFTVVNSDEVLALHEKIEQNQNSPAIDLFKKMQGKDLLPVFKIEIDRVTYYISHSFGLLEPHEITENNLNQYMAVGLVKIGEKVYPRLFYHSNSQGTWRVCPHADIDDKGCVKWIGKGLKETDTQLPIALICAMNNMPFNSPNPLQKTSSVKKLKESIQKLNEEITNPGVSVDRFSSFKLSHLVPNTRAPTESYRELVVHAQKKVKNSDLELKDYRPNFKKKFETTYQLPIYGKVKAIIVPSKNKAVQYLFHEVLEEDSILKGYVYLASAEKLKDGVEQVPISKFGVRTQFLNLHPVDSSLLEYPMQVEIKYQPKNQKKISNKYWLNWNQVRELSFIKQYYEHCKLPIPETV